MRTALEQEFLNIPQAHNAEVEANFPGASMERRVLDSLARSIQDQAEKLKPPLLSCSLRQDDLRTMQAHAKICRYLLDRIETTLAGLLEGWEVRRSKLEVIA